MLYTYSPSQVGQAPFQVLENHMRLMATVLNSAKPTPKGDLLLTWPDDPGTLPDSRWEAGERGEEGAVNSQTASRG